MAFKIATGGGKTVVMAMLIAWQVLNKLANRQALRSGAGSLQALRAFAGTPYQASELTDKADEFARLGVPINMRRNDAGELEVYFSGEYKDLAVDPDRTRSVPGKEKGSASLKEKESA